MRIALDAMGTDSAPESEIAGALEALRDDPTLRVLLVGDTAAIEAVLDASGEYPRDRVEVVHAPDRITSADSPAAAVRRKPNSSIVVGLRLQKEGKADAFVSAGSTGAVMASSLFLLRSLPGVDRPAIGTLLPTAKRPALMLDAGANIDCKPQHLLQFARLGNIYAQDLMGIERPRVALLNIGEEPEKGNELAVETHRLLAASNLNFVGNVEGRDIIQGACDVLVCDGFVGNVLLKFYESVASFVIELLERELEQTDTVIELENVFRVIDYSEYGGAPLLGVNGVTIICHGQSTPKAIRNAIKVALQAVRSTMVSHIARELAEATGTEEVV
ncbi:MAG: phosphate acyltransferase PlsX [Gemmatimonadota bacterium]